MGWGLDGLLRAAVRPSISAGGGLAFTIPFGASDAFVGDQVPYIATVEMTTLNGNNVASVAAVASTTATVGAALAPTGQAAVPAQDGASVTVSWEPAAADSTVTGYTVHARPPAGTQLSSISFPGVAANAASLIITVGTASGNLPAGRLVMGVEDCCLVVSTRTLANSIIHLFEYNADGRLPSLPPMQTARYDAGPGFPAHYSLEEPCTA